MRRSSIERWSFKPSSRRCARAGASITMPLPPRSGPCWISPIGNSSKKPTPVPSRICSRKPPARKCLSGLFVPKARRSNCTPFSRLWRRSGGWSNPRPRPGTIGPNNFCRPALPRANTGNAIGSGSASFNTFNGSRPSSWLKFVAMPSRPACRSGSITTWRWEPSATERRPGCISRCWLSTPIAGRLPMPSRRKDRIGGCPPSIRWRCGPTGMSCWFNCCARICGSAARSGWIMWWRSAGCSGFPRGNRRLKARTSIIRSRIFWRLLRWKACDPTRWWSAKIWGRCLIGCGNIWRRRGCCRTACSTLSAGAMEPGSRPLSILSRPWPSWRPMTCPHWRVFGPARTCKSEPH